MAIHCRSCLVEKSYRLSDFTFHTSPRTRRLRSIARLIRASLVVLRRFRFCGDSLYCSSAPFSCCPSLASASQPRRLVLLRLFARFRLIPCAMTVSRPPSLFVQTFDVEGR